ncbi:anti-sigma factor domain-containing protein [uncultured Amnibacterium sp.]|uniref:anti-sigma factor n=1 Tax=uncultured Amnibacterium sp. TaxID=1631851 RepID=UPI0035CB0C06
MTKPARDAHQLSGAYVLDALTPTEVDSMETAMRSSEDLRSEVAELTDTAVLLGLAVPPVEPSDLLRERLLALVDVTPQLPPLVAVAELDEPAEPESAARRVEPQHGATVTAGPRQWFTRERFTRPSVLLAAAAAVALLIGGSVLVQRVIVPSPEQAEASQFASLSSAPDLEHQQAAVAGGGTATVSWSDQQRTAAVVLAGERAVPSGKVLQVWCLDGDTATSAGIYQPAQGHTYDMLQCFPQSGDRVGVTVEPAGGSKQPTTTPIATIPLS